MTREEITRLLNCSLSYSITMSDMYNNTEMYTVPECSAGLGTVEFYLNNELIYYNDTLIDKAFELSDQYLTIYQIGGFDLSGKIDCTIPFKTVATYRLADINMISIQYHRR